MRIKSHTKTQPTSRQLSLLSSCNICIQCTGNPDEGLRGTHGNTPRRILQLTYDVTSESIPTEVEYVSFETCSSRLREMIFESTEKYQKTLLEDFEITGETREVKIEIRIFCNLTAIRKRAITGLLSFQRST